MPVKTTCEVVGVKQAINNLGKIDKQLQKDFKADATAIAQPAINAAKNVYKSVPLSGMQYKWKNNATRKLFRLLSPKRLQAYA
jgi:hypothetical protein